MKLGLISNSALNPRVHWTTVLPALFSGLAIEPSVRTISPPPLAWERRGEWGKVRSEVKGCDALFWVQLTSRPSGPIHLASYMNFGARRSNFILDAWRPLLTKIGFVATVERLDPCFIAYREAVDELKRRSPLAKFVWLPFGADTDVFYPRQEKKSIFAFWLGRRYEPLHRALLQYCEARGLRYVYPQGEGLPAAEIGRLTSSAQYFLATPRDLDDPKRTGGFSPLVMRYFEGLAAGTRLLGVLPRSGEYESILPTDAFCQVSPDGSDLAKRLDEDRSNPNNQSVVDAASAFVREHHSWRRRAEQVFNHLANGAAIEFPELQSKPQVSCASSSAGLGQDLPHDLKTTERYGWPYRLSTMGIHRDTYSRRASTPPFSARLLITGCGRSGTKYASFALQRLGLDVPHERLGRDGISSWTMAVPAESRPYGPPSSQVSFQHVFHQVREPLATISSCMTFNEESWDFICRHVECPPFAPVLTKAATYWLLWNEKAEEIATWRYRIEDFHCGVAHEICRRASVSFNWDMINSIPRNFNTRQEGRMVHILEELFRKGGFNVPTILRAGAVKHDPHSRVTWRSLQKADPALCTRIKAKATEYGYSTSEREVEPVRGLWSCQPKTSAALPSNRIPDLIPTASSRVGAMSNIDASPAQ